MLRKAVIMLRGHDSTLLTAWGGYCDILLYINEFLQPVIGMLQMKSRSLGFVSNNRDYATCT